MMKTADKNGLKKSTKAVPENAPEREIGNSLAAEGHKGCVLVGTAILEYRLEELLRAKWKQLMKADHDAISDAKTQKEVDAAFNKLVDDVLNYKSTSALFNGIVPKLKAARLMSLIDNDAYRAINQIAHTRNIFAHHPGQFKLSETSISSIMSVLSEDTRKYVNGRAELYASGQPGSIWRDLSPLKFTPPRVKFMSLCLKLNSYLQEQIIKIDPSDTESRRRMGGVQRRGSQPKQPE